MSPLAPEFLPYDKTKKEQNSIVPLYLTFRPSVGLPGFEPGMTGPESVVLPLHHSPIWIVVIFDTAKVEYYFYSAKKIVIFFRFLCDFLSATSLKSFLQFYLSLKTIPYISTLCIRVLQHRPTLPLHGLRNPNAR